MVLSGREVDDVVYSTTLFNHIQELLCFYELISFLSSYGILYYNSFVVNNLILTHGAKRLTKLHLKACFCIGFEVFGHDLNLMS